MMIPRDDGPNASVSVLKEMVPVHSAAASFLFFFVFWSAFLTILEILQADCDCLGDGGRGETHC